MLYSPDLRGTFYHLYPPRHLTSPPKRPNQYHTQRKFGLAYKQYVCQYLRQFETFS